jgi:hypothetical protein
MNSSALSVICWRSRRGGYIETGRPHRLRRGEWSLGVDQRGVMAAELQLPVPLALDESFDEAPPRRSRQHARRQEEAWPATHPALAIGREPAAGNDAIHVRMVRQRRAPGMRYQGRADACAQMLGVGGDGEQVLGGRVEQQRVYNGLVPQRDVGDGRRQHEHHMAILDGEFNVYSPLAYRLPPRSPRRYPEPSLTLVAHLSLKLLGLETKCIG